MPHPENSAESFAPPPEGAGAGSAPLTISFCTTCFNRAYQFKQTFDHNAMLVQRDPWVEWIVLNYCSGDDLDEFMTEKLPGASRRIIYARESTRRPWHASVAKNMAHRLGTGDVLMNLDCDNFIGDAIRVIRDNFGPGRGSMHLWSGLFGDGTCGRVVVRRDIYHRLGGYDESFHPMGFQDWDLLQRVLVLGYAGCQFPSPPGSAIKNSKEEGIRYCGKEGWSWEDFDRMNRATSRANILAGRYTANPGNSWARMSPQILRGGWAPDEDGGEAAERLEVLAGGGS